MGDLVRKRGRPISRYSKRHSKIIRLTDEQLEMLKFVSHCTGKTYTDILIEGLKNQYEECLDSGYDYYDDYDFEDGLDDFE